jgi:enterobactin synthetase component D
MFAAMFHDLAFCTFVERRFVVDVATLHQLAARYPMPDSLQRAVLKRQVEFLAGRVCAQEAIGRLTGDHPQNIVAQPDRAPGWPAGIVGSITHTTAYAAALVASDRHYQGLGIDCEVLLTPQHLELQRHICVDGELEALHAVRRDWPPERLLTLIFSAKESFYKCMYRQVQAFFGFSAARLLTLEATQHTFVIQLEHDLTPELCAGTQWPGRFACQDNLLMTAIVY